MEMTISTAKSNVDTTLCKGVAAAHAHLTKNDISIIDGDSFECV